MTNIDYNDIVINCDAISSVTYTIECKLSTKFINNRNHIEFKTFLKFKISDGHYFVANTHV